MNRQGLSIVEALIAIAIVGIALAALAPVFTSFSTTNRESERRGAAVAVSQQILDAMRQQRFSQWPINGEVRTIQTSLGEFEVEYQYCTGEPPDCFSSPNTRQVRLIIRHNERIVYEVETVYTRFD
jgi:type II secretory pathway pseudopilin PulG